MAAVNRCSSSGKTASMDSMQEKLEKWRRMKGRSTTDNCSAAVNRRRTAVVALTGMSASLNRFEKRKVKEHHLRKHIKEKAETGHKRISNYLSKCSVTAKRRKTFAVMRSISPMSKGVSHGKDERLNHAANQNTYQDKTLSMRERLELWRSENSKHPEKPTQKSEKKLKNVSRITGLKENTQCYHKLESTGGFCTPSHGCQVSQFERKPTTKKKPSLPKSAKKCSLKKNSNKYQQLESGSCTREAQSTDRLITTAKIDNGLGKDTSEARSYKDKTLEMSERLELWLAGKGKTPKYKTPAVLKNTQSVSKQNMQEKKRLSFTSSEEHDDTQCVSFGVISPGEAENIEERLQECLHQLEKGECESERVAAKLDLYHSSFPHTSQIAFYWLCRAKIAEREQDFDRVVCLFEQAFVFKAEPESLIKDAVCAFVKYMKENGEQGRAEENDEKPLLTPIKETPLSPDEFNSSIIKFCLTEATPYRRKFKATFGKPVLTPVRRSVRLERASTQHPTMLQEHGLTVRTLGELPGDVQENLLFKPNFAVQAELNEAWNELQRDF